VSIKPDNIDELNQQAWHLRVGDPNTAFDVSKEALALSETIGYMKGKATQCVQ
jgi:hypothetical protein